MNNYLTCTGLRAGSHIHLYTKVSMVNRSLVTLLLVIMSAFVLFGCGTNPAAEVPKTAPSGKKPEGTLKTTVKNAGKDFDTDAYDKKLTHMVNGDTSGMWPVKSAYPVSGAILPLNRIIAFYGNLYSTRMGILGEFAPQVMLQKLQTEVENWNKADSTIKAVPALHYIAVTAQKSPGKGAKYRQRMPFHQIDSVLAIAKQVNALVFLDIQIGFSTLQEEIPELKPYLMMPNVHLGIDPEFSMKTGKTPGQVVGNFDDKDINYAVEYLAGLVKENNLPPKILVVHRFTQGMVSNTKEIKTTPEVQIVMHMDGWGGKAKKLNTYKQYIHKEPVQFTGFKIFYKNDVKSGGTVLTPEELLQLKPQPVYIQYQ